jgi:flagellar motor component MotA
MLLSSAVIVTIIGFIGIMAHLEDRTALGPNLAVMMIVPLYIAIFLLIVIEPMRTAAEKNLQG